MDWHEALRRVARAEQGLALAEKGLRSKLAAWLSWRAACRAVRKAMRRHWWRDVPQAILLAWAGGFLAGAAVATALWLISGAAGR